MRAMSRAQHLSINILVHFRNARRINALLAAVAPDFMGRVIEIDPGDPSFIFQVRDRLEAGEMVAILGDRTGLAERSVEVDFLGAPASFPTGAFTLAAAVGCPVYLTFALHHPPRRYDLYCEPFATKIELPRDSRAEVLREYVERYARRLEYYCRLAPDNWFNFYDFWESECSPPTTSPS